MDAVSADLNSRKKDLAPPAADTPAQRLAELAALIDAVKERVNSRYPESTKNGPAGVICVGLPDLGPMARARDAAAGKVAAIGSVNPRPGGLVNNSIQGIKRMVARSLNWFVRDQVVFNRQVMVCLETCLETLADVNRTIHNLGGQANTQVQQLREEVEPLRIEARALRAKTSELQDLSSHWFRWREEWQLKLHRNEVEFLKSVADLNTALQQKMMYLEAAQQQRITGIEQSARELHAALSKNVSTVQNEVAEAFRKTARELDASYRQTASQLETESRQAAARMESAFAEHVAKTTAAMQDFERLANSNAETMDQRVTQQVAGLQDRFYADLERIRTEYERVIHAELRVIRQRLAASSPAPVTSAADAPPQLAFDYARFADRFRGSEQYVADSQRFYLPYFAGRRRVLDIGCGRGEFLSLLKEAGVPAKGIETSAESVEVCRSRGLDAEQADLFVWLAAQPDGALDGIFCSQVVEHLPVERLPEMVRLCATRLATGGVLVIETPNPECLAIFATHFYLDPTHTRPAPHPLLAFYMEESGMGRIEVHRRAPAIESMPEVGSLPEEFRNRFFGGLDYAIIGVKL
jgi:2-polyprenyl-3-methyl-5-hydroxy-6-metoxy-1,4-benzoquinol methylase